MEYRFSNRNANTANNDADNNNFDSRTVDDNFNDDYGTVDDNLYIFAFDVNRHSDPGDNNILHAHHKQHLWL